MKALITGGAGFIGSHLAQTLLEAGHQVSIIDDLSTGSVANIAHLKSNGSFSLHVGTITDEPLMAELVDECDVIYHLAAAVGVRLVVESPVRTIRTNLKGTEVVLDMACKKKKPVLVTSTSEVYGKSTKSAFAETDDLLIGPTTTGRWSYACSKAIDEFLALAYFKEKKLPVIVVRLFNTVGPRQSGRYGMVIPSFVQQALKNKTITVFGDGKQRRCFNHIKDTVWALIKLMENSKSFGEVFNVGNDHEISIMALAKTIKKMSASRSSIRLISYDKAYDEGFEDMLRRVPDLSKIKKRTGYRPRHTLEEILRDVIEFEKGRVDA